ncbi:MAG: RNA-binding protein, partial [Calditrichaeota bacterium]|nr:RNA-binding protein [Calditrichota bacterium]
EGQVYVCPDVSASMTWAAATGQRKGATSKVRCIDIAALVTAAILRKNPQAEVLPFAEKLRNWQVRLNSRDSVMTNARRLARIGGGGTNCSAPLQWLNSRKAQGDLVIYVSDDQSWVDARSSRSGTAMMQEWNIFKQRNPQARLVCLDIQPYETRQTYDREDILNIGGFSDNVFTVIAEFAAGRLNDDLWVREIEKVEI